MAIALSSVSTQQERSGESTTAVNLPPTVNDGDLLILVGNVVNATPPTSPAGWTQRVSLSAQNGGDVPPGLLVSTRIADGTEGSTVNVAHTSNNSIWQTLAFSGVDESDPIDGLFTANPDAGQGSLDLSLTGVTAGAALVYAVSISGAVATATPPSGYTETMDRSSGTRPGTAGYLLGSAGGSTGTVTVGWDGVGRNVGALLALKPIVAEVGYSWSWWDGTAWVDSEISRWDGSTWV